jgi:hypothetical protein
MCGSGRSSGWRAPEGRRFGPAVIRGYSDLVADRSLERPAHLQPSDGGGRLGPRKAAAAALALGLLSFLVAAVAHARLASMPDWRLTVPGFAATAVAAAASIARREPRGYWLWALGLGLAGAAIVLGWFLMIAIVIGATATVILLLHAVM